MRKNRYLFKKNNRDTKGTFHAKMNSIKNRNGVNLTEAEVMTNLDSILKSRDITLQTKVSLVKAMVFPVVMYGCESWTVKKTAPKN